jgi:pyruvate-formate lyase-activating enzyme
LSSQDGKFSASHARISFTPTPEELAEAALFHIDNARHAIVSFGQGCEGEPITEASVISRTVRIIRKRTDKGTIHINTNASLPDAIEKLIFAGIDSIRVSINSVNGEYYNRYFRPRNYKFSDVKRSIVIARRHKVFVSVNYLLFPGFNDTKKQIDSFVNFIKEHKINMVQLRNLSIDSEYFIDYFMHDIHAEPLGMIFLWRKLQKIKGLKIGYFNLPKQEFASFKNI